MLGTLAVWHEITICLEMMATLSDEGAQDLRVLKLTSKPLSPLSRNSVGSDWARGCWLRSSCLSLSHPRHLRQFEASLGSEVQFGRFGDWRGARVVKGDGL